MHNNIVYTGFDGDLLTHINLIQEYVIMIGKVPLNPEHALGYHVSTTSHDNKKTEVMKDCMSLVRVSEEVWVFIKEDNEELSFNELPEGVIIELILSCFLGHTKIKVLSLGKVLDCMKEGYTTYQGVDREISVEGLRPSFTSRHFEEMLTYTRDVMENLRNTVLIEIQDEDFKYADWVRVHAYRHKKVPLMPQYLIPRWLYERHGKLKEHERDIRTLGEATPEIWTIYRSTKELEVLERKHATKAGLQKTHFLAIEEFGIPKYSKPESWSITTKEFQENMNTLGRNQKCN